MSPLPCHSIGYREIVISSVVVSLYAETPKCRILTLRDLLPRVPAVVNGSDPIGKSRITISTCIRLLSLESRYPELRTILILDTCLVRDQQL